MTETQLDILVSCACFEAEKYAAVSRERYERRFDRPPILFETVGWEIDEFRDAWRVIRSDLLREFRRGDQPAVTDEEFDIISLSGSSKCSSHSGHDKSRS